AVAMELTYRFIDLNEAPVVPPGTAAFVDVSEDLMGILQRLVLENSCLEGSPIMAVSLEIGIDDPVPWRKEAGTQTEEAPVMKKAMKSMKAPKEMKAMKAMKSMKSMKATK
ncbi:unnamed protein product, partial [Effrenium voratum]